MRHDASVTHHITVAGTLSPRFARGCGCGIVGGAAPGTTILSVRDPDGARLGAVLRGLENLGVEVKAVGRGPEERHVEQTGGDRA